MPATGNNALLSKRLSIRTSTDGFSFCALDLWRHYPVPEGTSAEEYLERLEEAISKLLRLGGDYAQVQLLMDYPSTRVPLDEFRSEREQAIYRITFGDTPLQQSLVICHEVIPTLDVVELFPVDPRVRELVLGHFPEASVHGFYADALASAFAHHRQHEGIPRNAQGWGQAMAKGKGQAQGRAQAQGKGQAQGQTQGQGQGQGEVPPRRLYANTEGNAMLLAHFEADTLRFANTYPERQPANQLYYTLYAWKHLALDQERDTLVLSEAGKKGGLADLARHYIRHVVCEL